MAMVCVRKNIFHIRGGYFPVRHFADVCAIPTKKALILGAYDGCNLGEYYLTKTGEKFDCQLGGKLKELMRGSDLRRGKAQVFSDLNQEFQAVAVVGLGEETAGYSEAENLNQLRENIRVGAGVGAMSLQEIGMNNIFVEGFTSPEAAAEGSALAIWRYQDLKSKENKSGPTKLELFEDPDRESWDRGMVKAEAQNIARKLEETPANLMTPSIFAQKTMDALCPCGVQVEVRDRDWLELKKMTAMLSIARGSCEHPLFMELSYCGGNLEDKPVVMVGKGVTFDSGGVCLKNPQNMEEHRGDMAGAAVVVGVFRAVAALTLPINLFGLIPLCENMPGGMAVKPGDVVTAMNGKTIRLENTDNEGRVILADALAFADQYKPCLIMNVATLSMGMRRALGFSASGAFSTSDVVWRELSRAGAETGDRVWRFPFWKHYTTKVTDYTGVDVNNVGKGRGGGACLGAAFLMEFVPPNIDFVHLDITGTGMLASGLGYPYLRRGTMTGRPTRTIVQFLYQMVCPHDKGDAA